MTNQGFIYLHRKLKEKGYYKKSQYIHLWIHILLSANHKETKFLWNGKEQNLKKGQLLVGRLKLSEDTGIPPSTIEDILKILEKEQQIRQQKTNKFRIITIVNWNIYQKGDKNSDIKPTSSRHQADTYNNNNNEKNEKNTNELNSFSSNSKFIPIDFKDSRNNPPTYRRVGKIKYRLVWDTSGSRWAMPPNKGEEYIPYKKLLNKKKYE